MSELGNHQLLFSFCLLSTLGFCFCSTLINVEPSEGPSDHQLLARDVAALSPLKLLIMDSNSTLSGWLNGSVADPCGEHNCGAYSGGHTDCAYEGVSCSEGRITALHLGCGVQCRHPISGPLPDSLADLTALQSLSLRGNALTGTLPSGEGWSNLKYLDLHGNMLESSLPEQWGANLQHLQHMDLSSNRLTGELPASWCGMKQITRIDLSDNDLSGDVPHCWGSSESLQLLKLNDNCLMCGAVLPMHAKLYTSNTSLGSTGCSGVASKCSSSSSSFYNHLMIVVAAVLGAFMICVVQRHVCWRWKVARLMMARAARGEREPEDEAEQGVAGRLKPGLKRIPSFEAFVELAEPSVKPTHAAEQLPSSAAYDISSNLEHSQHQGITAACGSTSCRAATAPDAAGTSAACSIAIAASGARGDSATEVQLLGAIHDAASPMCGVNAPYCVTSPSASQSGPTSQWQVANRTASQQTAAQQQTTVGARQPSQQLPPQTVTGRCRSREELQSKPCEGPPQPPSVIVMPDGQHVALAVPEIQCEEEQGTHLLTLPAHNYAALDGLFTQASTQHQQSQQQLALRLWQHASVTARSIGRAILSALEYLFVQPVNEEDFSPMQRNEDRSRLRSNARMAADAAS